VDSSGGAGPPPAPPELSTIKVGLLPTAESAPVFLALTKNYFQEEGLTVQPMIITGAGAAAPQVESGQLDLAQTDFLTVMRRNAAQETFKVVAGLYRAAPGSYAVVVDAKSKIRTAADLRRKTVAVPNLMVLQGLALTGMLERAGLELDDVKQREKPYPEMLNALRSGQVDAAVLAEPFVTAARQSRRTRVLEDPMSGEFANLYTAGMMASDRWIQENPRTLAAFQRGLAKAQRLITSDPREVGEVLPRYTKVSKAVAAGLPPGVYPARLDLAQVRRIGDLALAYGWVRSPVKLGDVVAKGG
ncbi:ABC transporter substrate-binding protein, partial [Nonomuraea aridisoli]|uniref:ABC transporter substrate-binding protein n=1 Tax=Nonomuraea aridisoli TaxID=2070368 RepID=UPI0015E8BD9F